MGYILRLARDQRGATAIEYALIATLISVAAIAGFANLGSRLQNLYGNVTNNLS